LDVLLICGFLGREFIGRYRLKWVLRQKVGG